MKKRTVVRTAAVALLLLLGGCAVALCWLGYRDLASEPAAVADIPATHCEPFLSMVTCRSKASTSRLDTPAQVRVWAGRPIAGSRP
jgi:hypothetical protein